MEPMSIAIELWKCKTIELLKCVLLVQDTQGQTALHVTCQNGHKMVSSWRRFDIKWRR